MKKVFLYSIGVILFTFTVFLSCDRRDQDLENQGQSNVEGVIETRSIGSGINLTPDNTWSTPYSSGNKIKIFRKGTSNTYVIAVDLSTGAKVIPYYEFASGQSNATSTNPSPGFVKSVVNDFSLSSLGWFSVVNLGFFGWTNQSSFLLRKNGTLVSSGYGTFDSGEGPRRTLAISGSTATVYEGPGNNSSCNTSTSAGKTNLYNVTSALYSSATYVMTGLHPLDANKGSGSVPRTFVGVRQKTPLTNGGPAYIYILVTTAMNQQTAYNTLVEFECDGSEIIMFDGGGSTQMKVGNSVLIESSDSPDRSVPIFLAIKEN
ncbi:MAG: phosphodiester glycosidase family protein [Candidatus Peribacteria bacterium]|jgi:hypothetical protein|nr:phosphodiester glycosidase family protein [Candidatus Peribacteria bacterium]